MTCRDTAPSQVERHFELLRAMTPLQRGRLAAALTQGVRRMAELGIRMQHPDADEHEVRVRLVARIYGRAFARRIYGSVPDDAR